MKLRLKNSQKITILYTSDIWDIMQDILKRERKIDRNKEHFWTISLNNRFQILDIELVSLGSLSSSIVTPTEVLSVPLQKRATAVVLVHNNSAGELTASEPIKDLTDQLIQACKLMRTPVFDHVIITERSYYSFKESGLLSKLELSKKYVLPYELEEQHYQEMKAAVQESVQEGIGIGEQKEKLEIAKSMLKKGYSADVVEELTGLGREAIEKLKQSCR